MDTKRTRLIVATAAILGVTLGLLITAASAKDAKSQNTRQNSIASDANTALPDTARRESIAAYTDTGSPQSKPPVLKISGKENPDVYLQSLDVQVEVTGSIASTRYTMVFKNKTSRVLEGELTFPLPDGRAVTYYALDINGKMREAVPVEKAKGTEVFEEIEQRRVDPGLLERVEGNNFRTRIYPIPANGKRTVSIGYEEELTLEKELLHYRLPMAYPALEKFSVKATVWNSGQKPLVPQSADELRFDKAGQNYVAVFSRENYRPARSLNFALPAPADIPRVMMQSAQGSYYFFASVAPKMETRKKQWDDDLAIIWDVSLSGSQRNLKREMEMLNIIFAEKKETNVHLYFLNNRFKKIANKGTSNGEYKVTDGKWDGLKKTLEAAVFDGGTDFSQINLKNIAGNEILFFSDGISTLSDADFIKNAKVDRPIHCVVSSAKADYSVMKLITGKSKGKFVNMNALSSDKLMDELLNETLQFLGTEHGKSVREVYPSIATPVHGDFSVAGISDTANTNLTLLFGFGNKVEKRIAVKLDAKSDGSQVDVHKLWAQKKITELDLDYEKNRAELTDLGQQFGIVTRNTSLIVLETVEDYIRYNITPPASEKELYAEYQRRVNGWERQKSGNAWQFGNAAARPRGSMTNRPIRDMGDDEDAPRPRGSMTALAVRDDDEPRGSRTESAVPGSNKGGGDPRARVTQNGVLGIASGQSKGKAVASADIFDNGGFATDVDRVLSSVGGLKSGGDGGVGRKGVAGIGYGAGYGSGFGGGGSGVNDLLGGLMGGDGGGLVLKKRGELNVSSPDFLKGGTLTGGRSRASIQRVVMQNMAALRYAYVKRLRDKPGMTGKIVVKLAIDEFGKVISAQVVESTMNDAELETIVVSRAKSWNFEFIDKPGDVTEVTYPFVFQEGGPSYHTTQEIDSATLARELAAQERERAAMARARELREKALAEQARREEAARISRDTLNGAVFAAEEIKKWRNTDFDLPKPKYPTPDNASGQLSETGSAVGSLAKSADYMRDMTGKLADDYKLYLKLRGNHANSPTFYFDMANWFYANNDKETALRILTSIADLELENASLYRLLGYRLKEYGEYALEKFVCKKVVQWRPMEPQSHRDYALALADDGETQAALDSLYGLLTKTYSANIRDRSRGIAEVTITEINRLIAKHPNLNKSKIYKPLLIDIPVDVRVVINWNMNSTDIDLHVVDPTGEECYYGHRKTRIGGRISPDVTNGYGPEQFLLKNAVKGKYKVYVDYFGDRQVTNDGPSTIMAEVYIKYADKTEQRKVVCLQMSNARRNRDGNVLVAEFTF